ncbi:MAG TPA: hypothetical protein VJQ25_03900, partial [Nitrospira sp.]|nr:hypothetical protein [Nitrospira sp.]
DGTTLDNTSAVGLTPATTFTKIGGLLPTDVAKTVRNVSVLIQVGAGTTLEALVGGLDVRSEPGVSTFIQGDAGDGYWWEGAANNSPSRRDAFVASAIFGAGGQYSPTVTYEIVSRQGQVLEDVSDHVLDGSINYDLEADQHKGSCSVTLDEPGLIEVLGDEWLRISLRVERPDGSVDEGPLGVFILDPPKERWNEGQDEWVYPGKDLTSLLSTTFIRGNPSYLVLPQGEEETVLLASYTVLEGTPYMNVVNDILINDVGLRDNQFSFAGLTQSFDVDTAFDPVVSVMEILQGTLEGAGWMSPWMAPPGIITSAPAGVNPATVLPSIVLATGNNSRVRWPFEVDVDAGGIGNRVRVISAKDVTSMTRKIIKRKKKKNKKINVPVTKRHAVEVWRMNNDPTHPLSYPRLGRWLDLPDVVQPLVRNDAEATALADQALIEGGQLPVRVRLTTEAMVRGLNEVYELALTDHWGEPIASGQGRYWCRGWSIQLGPPWEMVHNLSRTIDFRAASFVSE